MSSIKDRSYLSAVMRHDFSGNDVLVALCKTTEKAEDLVGEYTQLFLDKGFKPEECYFYPTVSIYYDS